jgi:hypothetical protein
MKPRPLILVSLLLASCASAPVVYTDHDPAADFASYRTYAWRQEPPISNPLLKQRIVGAIDAELGGKGWSRVPEANADVVLVGNVSARDEQTIEAFYIGADWNEWGWRRDLYAAGGPPHVAVHTYKVGTLVLDMFDVRTKKAVWRATAEGTVPTSPEHVNEDAMQAVHGMFADFPPADASN